MLHAFLISKSLFAKVVTVALGLLIAEEVREATSSQANDPESASAVTAQPVSESENLAAFKQRSEGIIAAYMREQPIKRLQIGAGSSRRPGWPSPRRFR